MSSLLNVVLQDLGWDLSLLSDPQQLRTQRRTEQEEEKLMWTPVELSAARMSLQQKQQLLSPSQLQDLIQQKQQSLLLQQQQLRDFHKRHQQQIHLRMLQHQSSKKTKELSPQHLMFQHLLQLQQQQLLQIQRPVLSSSVLPPVGFSSAEIQRILRELTNEINEEKTSHSSADSVSSQDAWRHSGDQQTSSTAWTNCAEAVSSGVLYNRGVCNWPGCESVCENVKQFVKHISNDHRLDDKSTAQCRVQVQVFQQLEYQLCKERQRLQAMMTHLHLPSAAVQWLPASERRRSPQSDPAADPHSPELPSGAISDLNPPDLTRTHHFKPPAPVIAVCQAADEDSAALTECQQPAVHSQPSESEYELYKNTDVRPPFTYATLIRQAIMESSDMQLTLNEIYNWFTRSFAYFRRNAATWKNAVRHNLSLHKCFVRVENVKGAVWRVDEGEYQKRRSQKITGSHPLMKNVSPHAAVQTAQDKGQRCE
uniref:Fork-head domain-containing protein n=1 Tax=Cynoglossus semilaevis TaxID=244447 RepID=A0A3P8VGQ9_CYNSE